MFLIEDSLGDTWANFFAMWKTPQNSLDVLMLTFLIYITTPIFEWQILETHLANDIYQVDADSIGLGLFQFLAAWVLFAPLVLGFTIWILWKYTPQVPLFGFNSKRIIWSFFWTLVFGFLFFYCFASAVRNIAEHFFIGMIQNLSLSYLFLLFRASIIFRN
jgi:hypothetical protein